MHLRSSNMLSPSTRRKCCRATEHHPWAKASDWQLHRSQNLMHYICDATMRRIQSLLHRDNDGMQKIICVETDTFSSSSSRSNRLSVMRLNRLREDWVD